MPTFPLFPLAYSTEVPNIGMVMWRRHRGLFSLLLVVVFAGLVALFLYSRDAHYKGRSASVWIRGFSSPKSEDIGAASEAVKQLGEKAIPALRRLIQHRDTPLKLKLIALAGKQKYFQFRFRTARDSHRDASYACMVLKPSVRAQLVNDWLKLMENPQYPEDIGPTLGALRKVGPEAFEPLMKALTNSHPCQRMVAAACLQEFSSHADEVLPGLVERLQDSDEQVRVHAALSLGALGLRPDMVVPALLQHLDDPVPWVRYNLLGALASFTNQATAIVPFIIKTLQDPQLEVRIAATNLLQQIAPDTAAKAGSEPPQTTP